MESKNLVLRTFLFIVILLIIIYSAVVFHSNEPKRTSKFDILYEELKDNKNGEKSLMDFSKYNEEAGDYLSKRLSTERDDVAKINAVQIIGIVGCINCEENLLVLLKDQNWRVRFFTIDTLDKLEYAKFPLLLTDIITGDSNKNVKVKAIMTLGKYGNSKDIAFLENLGHRKEYKDEKLSKAIDMALVELKALRNDRR